MLVFQGVVVAKKTYKNQWWDNWETRLPKASLTMYEPGLQPKVESLCQHTPHSISQTLHETAIFADIGVVPGGLNV